MSPRKKRGKTPTVKTGVKRQKGKDKKRYHCTVCNKNFLRKWNLKNHLRIHEQKRAKAKCPYCEAKFFDAFNFRQHCSRYHPKKKICASVSMLTWMDDKREVCVDLPSCEQCNRSFPREENYKSHLLRYHSKHQLKNFCETCHISFACVSSLKKHLQTCNRELEINGGMEVQFNGANIKSNQMRSILESLSNEETVDDQSCDPDLNDKMDTPVSSDSIESVPKYNKIQSNKYPSTQEKLFKKPMMKCECLPDSGCGDNCLNRMSLQECIRKDCNCRKNCTNTQIQTPSKLPFSVFKTVDKGWGVKTLTEIKSNTFIAEYVGEIVSEIEYKEQLRQSEYCLYLGAGYVIDADKMGNISRFFNHSCQPNCRVEKWLVNGFPRMAFFSERDISPNEELCYDYNFHSYNIGVEINCECKADQCRGVLGRKLKRSSNSVHRADQYNQSLVSLGGTEETIELDDTSEDEEFFGFPPVVRIQCIFSKRFQILKFHVFFLLFFIP